MSGIALGHFLAFASVFIWSALYVSTKVLLEYFSALELLVFQSVIGYLALLAYRPKKLKVGIIEEGLFILAGLSGITFYNLFLNLAMELSFASNVSVIIAIAPLCTALIMFLLKIEKPYKNFFIGFAISICGISLLSFSGQEELGINPLGDLLAFISALSWGIYAIVIAKIMEYKYDGVLVARRVLFYGILGLLPSLFFLEFKPDLMKLKEPIVFINLIFVAIFASGICFILWNKATAIIGALRTNIYVYLTPLITIIASLIVLDERLTLYMGIGAILTLVGVIVSERRKSDGKCYNPSQDSQKGQK